MKRGLGRAQAKDGSRRSARLSFSLRSSGTESGKCSKDMFRGNERDKARRGAFKKGIDNEESRRRRDDVTVKLRKEKRNVMLAKRRNMRREAKGSTALFNGMSASSSGGGGRQDALLREQLVKLPELKAMLNSNDRQDQFKAVQSFRRLLSIERNPPIKQVIRCGVVNRIVNLLDSDDMPALQFEAAWALTNIASGKSEDTLHVIQQGAVPRFVRLLRSPSAEVREQSVWALGNIAGESSDCRDLALREGALAPIMQLCNKEAKLPMLRNATWTIANFCRGKPQPNFRAVAPALRTLSFLIYSKDPDILTDACWALSYLSDDNGAENSKIQAVINSGVSRRLVELLLNPDDNVKIPALRTVGNIVTGDDIQTQVILNASVLPCLLSLLSSPKKAIRKETCWTISNITAGNRVQIEAVKEANIFPSLINILRTAEYDVKKEAAWALSNATCGGTDEQIRYLVRQGAIAPLCQLFKQEDQKIVMVALEGIENILRVGVRDMDRYNGQNKHADFVEECGGLDLIEKLQRHDDREIYNKVVNIIQVYFDSEEAEEEDDSLAPTVANDQFEFGMQGDGSNIQNFDFDFS